MRAWPRILMVAFLCGGLGFGCDDLETVAESEDLSAYVDPGAGPWDVVASEDLIEVCGLDPDILAEIDATAPYPYAIVRYGLLCHEHYPEGMPAEGEIVENFSATKTLAATVVGRAVTLSADLPRPLSDQDRMDAWVGDITFNPDALVAHVLAMLGHNEDLSYGARVFSYDATGSVQLNRLGEVIEAVIAQAPARFGGATTTGEFARRELFDPLGMDESTWTGEIFGYTWASSLRDMARLGLLLVHDGVWDGRRLIDEEWVYKMTHPSFEDANTAYGYLTWLAANTQYALPTFESKVDRPYGTCQPPAIWPEHPHAPGESTDCGYLGAYPCEQTHDVGVFAAVGFGGQLVVGHPGLDLVIVSKEAGQIAFVTTPWDLVRRALIEHDPVYAGDSEAFCAAYAAGDHAPDLITLP